MRLPVNPAAAIEAKFIVGVNDRHQGNNVLLVEIKGGHILNCESTLEKIDAEHKQYGKPWMLTQQDDGRFWVMRYIESARKIELIWLH